MLLLQAAGTTTGSVERIGGHLGKRVLTWIGDDGSTTSRTDSSEMGLF